MSKDDPQNGAASDRPDDFDYSQLERLAVATDVVLFTIRDESLDVLLIRRNLEPHRGQWALPGGFVRRNESLEDAALRELREETGVKDVFLEQLYTFGKPDRDPRFRVVSVVFYALVNSMSREVVAGTDADDADWFSLDELPVLAFDHRRIIDYALQRLRYKLEYAPVAFQLLPRRFTLTELQTVYETILDQELDKRNFRRKVLGLGFLKATDEYRREGAHRPARLYEFMESRFEEATGGGVIFQF